MTNPTDGNKSKLFIPKIVLSLYDYTGEALKPWAEAGYTCYALDIQHNGAATDYFPSGGMIRYCNYDLQKYENIEKLKRDFKDKEVVFAMAFPVCQHLAVSGAAHFESKRKANPNFQKEAASYAVWCAELFQALGCPYFIENPVSVLSTLWRKPDYKFHPYEYGGYIDPSQAEHPKWPEHIAPMDAYPKKTCLWTGGNFTMPEPCPVKPETGHSRQHLKLGGRSMKTKNIRSATPRGFAQAVFNSNNATMQEKAYAY
jgi:hypothetical protein